MSTDILGRESFVSRRQGSLAEQSADCGGEVGESWSEVWFGRLVRP